MSRVAKARDQEKLEKEAKKIIENTNKKYNSNVKYFALSTFYTLTQRRERR